MTTQNAQILPGHNSGSQVTVSELPITQWGDRLLVDARLLHQKLQSKQDFSDWIKKRIADYGFSEKEDFTINLRKNKGRGRTAIDYLLTLDTAKEIAMLERNEIGRAIRRYFIQKEREARGEIFALPGRQPEEVFGSLKPFKVNERVTYPFRAFLVSIGYKKPSGAQYYYIKNYSGHVVNFDGKKYISKELALQIYYSRYLRLTRKVNKQMRPVLPLDFSDPKQIEGGLL